MNNYNTLLTNAAGYGAAFRAVDITTDEMQKSIKDWFDLYYQNVSTKEEDPCQRIAYTIVRKLTKTVFSEYEATSKDAFATEVLEALATKAHEAMQMALIGGEALLKPVFYGDKLRCMVVPRTNILVFGRDAEGNMTDIGTIEQSSVGKFYFTLLERRTVDERGFLTITNRLFRSYARESLGLEVPLNSMEKYKDIPAVYTFPNPIWSVGMISLRTPVVNCVDGSADAVSIYAAAVGLIHNINRNEAQLNGEFERGESRILVSADMLRPDKFGRRVISDNVFVGLDEDQETMGITTFSPALREASFLARKQEYLRNVENVIGMKRGLLSEVEAAERTATEITSSAGEYNLTIIDFQRVWKQAIDEALRVCGIMGQMYRFHGAHEVSGDMIVINWGNGVLYDEAKTDQELRAQVQNGLLQPERYLGWYYNMPCDTPAQRARIRKDYMPESVEESEDDDA